MPTHLQIISAERVVYEDDVDMVICPGIEGELGLLPRHAPVFTLLQPGELRVRKGAEEISMVVTGGFLQVSQEKVIILADAAERADEIDEARAMEARRRAEERLATRASESDLIRAEAALRRSLTRLSILERRRRRRDGRPLPPG
jgi:F-type H+-transporting ATPase subunit epsilon